MNREERKEIIMNLVASIFVVTTDLDLDMSQAILKSTSDKFGEDIVAKCMTEILDVLNGEPSDDQDLLNWTAVLGFAIPQPQDRVKTIH